MHNPREVKYFQEKGGVFLRPRPGLNGGVLFIPFVGKKEQIQYRFMELVLSLAPYIFLVGRLWSEISKTTA